MATHESDSEAVKRMRLPLPRLSRDVIAIQLWIRLLIGVTKSLNAGASSDCSEINEDDATPTAKVGSSRHQTTHLSKISDNCVLLAFSMDSRPRTVEQIQLPILPQDVFQNILSRLPVKSLMRFRCVSKSVDALVHDPQFVKLHFDRTLEDLDQTNRRRIFVGTNPPQCILCENLDEDGGHDATMPIEYPSAISADDVEIVGSCNGLLCFMVFDSYNADNKGDYKFVLWNPSTRTFRELAKPPGPLLGHLPDMIPIYGFGYDLATDDYKIIRAVSDADGTTSTYLEIYTLKDNAWRQIQASLPCVLTANYWGRIEHYFPGIKTRGSGVHTNGAVHWLESRNVDTPDESDLILSFNLASEQFEEVILLPDYDKEYSSPGELQVLRGHLSLIVHNFMTSEREIWVMEEYGVKESWTMILTMPADPGPEFQDSFIGDWFIPFSCCANGCLLMDMNGCELLIYDPKRKMFSKIELGENRDLFLVQEFVDTLVSPHLSFENTNC